MQRVVDVVELRPGGVVQERYRRENGPAVRPDPISLLAGLSDDRAARFLRLIAMAAEQLLAAQDAAAMVRDLFALIQDELRLDVFCNFRFVPPDRLELEAYGGLTAAQAQEVAVLALGDAVCGCVARDRRPIHAIAVQENDEPATAFVRAIGLRSYACTPLMENATLLGTLSFGRRWADRFDDDELHFLHTICHYVALAKQRLRAQANLRNALASQDALLQELNHRVRNALQLVVGLLALESDAANGAEMRQVLDLLRDRILVIATAHRHLYQDGRPDGQLDGIRIGAMLAPLVADCGRRSGSPTFLRIDGELVLPVEKAVAVALTIDDLLREGCGDGASLELAVNHTPEMLTLRSVRGTAPELAGPAPPAATRLRNGLLRQLRATLRYEQDGSGFVLDIPLDRP